MGKPVILLLRPRDRLVRSRRLCARLGLRAVAAPALEPEPLRRAAPIPPADVVAFTSRRAVEALRGPELARAGSAEVWSIGPDTARALRERGVASRTPRAHSSEGLLSALRPRVRGRRVLLLRSEQGGPALARGLRAAGARVRTVALYRLTRSQSSALGRAVRSAAAGRVDLFAFTSAGTVESLFAAARTMGVGAALKRSMARGVVAALGEPTRRALRRHGVRADFVPARADFAALVRGAFQIWKRRQRVSL